MFYPENVIDEVRSQNDIVDVISSHVKLVRKGASYMGLCPFHNEKTPSFSVLPDKQIYHCFGCGVGGNVITFVMQHENYGFVDALKVLAERVHYDLPDENNSEEALKAAKNKETIYKMNHEAAVFFRQSLKGPEGKDASAYLDKRMIGSEMRKRYALGYCPGKGTLARTLLTMGYTDSDLEMSGLVAKNRNGSYYDRFSNRVIFPITDATTRITGFGGRAMADGVVKYLNSPETLVFDKSRSIYSINFARQSKTKEFILVEGYMDVISLHQAGYPQAVAALGTAFNGFHASLLKKYCESVILLFDSDDAGTKAALRALPHLAKEGIGTKVLQVQGAKDPDEYIKKNGAAAFAELLKTAQSRYAFQIIQMKGSFDMSDISGKAKFASEAAKIVSTIDSAVERELREKEISEIAGVSIGAVRAETKKLVKAQTPAKIFSAERKTGDERAKRGLAYFAATDKRICSCMEKILSPEEMGGGFYSKLLAIIYKKRAEGKEPNPSSLVDEFEGADQRALTELFANCREFETMQGMEKEKGCNELCRMVKSAAMEAEMASLKMEMLKNPDDASTGDKYRRLAELADSRRKISTLNMLTFTG
ncbi:MAG: DNA primase [Clostridiales bacterium]|jgi:DNA primase|nr:DNA primase [Clostridiales bacterium]